MVRAITLTPTIYRAGVALPTSMRFIGLYCCILFAGLYCCTDGQLQLWVLHPHSWLNGLSIQNVSGGFFYSVHPEPHPTTRWLDYKSTHTMVPSHSGFFLFNHYTFQGFCLRAVIQPLVETTGLLNSWVFLIFTTNLTNLNGSTRGGLLPEHPHGQHHSYSQSTDWGCVLNDIPTGPNRCL